MKNDKMAIITCMILVFSSMAGCLDDEDNVEDLVDENIDDSMDDSNSTVDSSTVDSTNSSENETVEIKV